MNDIIKNLATHKKEISFDNEAYEILEGVSPVYRNAIINMGIKLVSQTDFFKKYMELNGLHNTEVSTIYIDTSSINNIVTPTITATQVVQEPVKQETTVKAVTSWDDFN